MNVSADMGGHGTGVMARDQLGRKVRTGGRLAVVTLLTLLVCACGHAGGVAVKAKPVPAGIVATPGLSPAERVAKSVALLGGGREAEAKAELQAALAIEPANPAARSLLNQIEQDPKALLGEKHYSYRMRQGETLSSLAGRLLDDRLMFYALARYNGIAVPEQTTVGQVLLIPGTPKKPVPARKPSVAKAPPSAPAAAVVARDPERAGQLRRSALEQLSLGQVARAEALLQQAKVLDPASAVIQRDLDRARRIQASVRPRS